MDSYDYQRLCSSLIEIKKFCVNQKSCLTCDFFIKPNACFFMREKSPKFWKIPATILTNMNCQEVVVEAHSNDTTIKEGD